MDRLQRYCYYWRSLAQIKAIRRTSGRYQTFPRSLKSWRDYSVGAITTTSVEFSQLLPVSVWISISYSSLHRNELLNDVYTAGDDRRCTVVIGLDISAAFDTISHKTLLHRLYAEFGLSSTALDWVCSYLSDRRQYVKIGQHSSGLFDCSSGVPQGSVLGPLLFAVYVSPVGNVIESFGVRRQQYADDTQLYLSMRPSDSAQELDVLRSCSTAVRDWYNTIQYSFI